MSIDNAREHLRKWERHKDIIEFGTSSSTVELAAKALGVGPERIAKSITFRSDANEAIMVVAAGDVRIDNAKFRMEFGMKAKMLSPEEVIEYVGHEIGGVCPFGIKESTSVYLDFSLKRFSTVFPACGSHNSAIELTCGELEQYTSFIKWVDVCKQK